MKKEMETLCSPETLVSICVTLGEQSVTVQKTNTDNFYSFYFRDYYFLQYLKWFNCCFINICPLAISILKPISVYRKLYQHSGIRPCNSFYWHNQSLLDSVGHCDIYNTTPGLQSFNEVCWGFQCANSILSNLYFH